jgi:hypothetical protein
LGKKMTPITTKRWRVLQFGNITDRTGILLLLPQGGALGLAGGAGYRYNWAGE